MNQKNFPGLSRYMTLILFALMFMGMLVVILSLFLDLDFMKLRIINTFLLNIKENTKLTLLIVSSIVVLALITKIYILIPVGIISGFLIPGILARNHQKKVSNLKIMQWTALIDDLSSGVRAGLTISQALLQALSNCEEPLRQEFLEAILEFNRSGQISKVMDILEKQVQDPVGISTLRLLQVVLKTGANDLATSLSILSNSSRETINLIQELKAKQAWVLNGAKVSVFAPWLVLVALWTQESVRASYQDLTGQFILFLVATVGLVGYLSMKKIGKIEAFTSREI